MNYQQILNKASNVLQLKNLKSPKLDSELILAKTLNVRREEILLNLNKKINKSDLNKFNYYLNMRSNHKPIAHIVNFKYFWKYKFFVNRNVLIPRPETELIIEKILKILPSSSNKNILDIGTGSGCIAISLIKDNKKIKYENIYMNDKVSKISIVGAGMVATPGVTYKMFRSLSEEKINILAISTSEIKISVIIDEKFTISAVKKLHKTFNLD